MLGNDVKIKWTQEADALVAKTHSKLPDWQVLGIKIEFKK